VSHLQNYGHVEHDLIALIVVFIRTLCEYDNCTCP